MWFVDLARCLLCAAALLLPIGVGSVGVAAGSAAGSSQGGATHAGPSAEPVPVVQPQPLTLDSFRMGDPPCYDRSVQLQTAILDTHVHFRPFGGPAVPFDEVVEYFEATGVVFANVYGIGQMLPASSSCTYYLDCPGTPVTPTLKNDFVNAANVVVKTPKSLHLTLSMAFPDLSDPGSVLAGVQLLDAEYPALFRWMGEVNLVKQALFDNGHEPVPAATIAQWAPFMELLRDRGIPLAVHADLGSDDEPTRYLPLTRNDSIRTLALTPIVADLREVAEPPRYQAIAPQAVKLRGLGYPDSLIAECTDVTPKTVAKAIRWYMNR